MSRKPRPLTRRGSAQPVNGAAKPSKSKKKRHSVGVGDLVAYYSQHGHMTGTVGEVLTVLSKDEVVVRGIAPQYDQYTNQKWVVKTYRPSGQTSDGEDKAEYSLWITKVLFRATPAPPKPPKKKIPPKVLRSAEELIEHLATGDPKEKIILPEQQEKSA